MPEGDDGMDMMYPSDSAEKETASTEKESPETVDEENEENASSTILAPKSAMGRMTKVGDKCMMRVVADHGDEVELEYSRADKQKSTEMSSDEEIEALDKG